jgi:hypothetical protein
MKSGPKLMQSQPSMTFPDASGRLSPKYRSPPKRTNTGGYRVKLFHGLDQIGYVNVCESFVRAAKRNVKVLETHSLLKKNTVVAVSASPCARLPSSMPSTEARRSPRHTRPAPSHSACGVPSDCQRCSLSRSLRGGGGSRSREL